MLNRLPAFIRPGAKRWAEESAVKSSHQQVEPEDIVAAKRQYFKNMGLPETGPGKEFKLYEVTTCQGRERHCPFYFIGVDHIQGELENVLKEARFSERLEEQLRGFLLPPNRFMVAVSGCPNSCAQEQIKDFGVCVVKEPVITSSPCNNCVACLSSCLEDAIMIIDGKPKIDRTRCIRCGMCSQVCPTGSLVGGEIKYQVSVGGKLGRHPQFARRAHEYDTTDKVVDFFNKTLNFYLGNMRRGERFGSLLNRVGWHTFDPCFEEKVELEDFLV